MKRTLAAALSFASDYLRAVGLGLGLIARALDELDRKQHREPAAPAREDGEPLDLDAVRAFYGPRGVPRVERDGTPPTIAEMREAFRAISARYDEPCIDPACPLCHPRLVDPPN